MDKEILSSTDYEWVDKNFELPTWELLGRLDAKDILTAILWAATEWYEGKKDDLVNIGEEELWEYDDDGKQDYKAVRWALDALYTGEHKFYKE